MQIKYTTIILARYRSNLLSIIFDKGLKKWYHNMPFINFYEKVTGEPISNDTLRILRTRHPNLEKVSQTHIDYVLQVLKKFGLTAIDACKDPHVFCMNAISMENYAEILKECSFVKIIPKYIIKYHSIVRSKTIASLKEEGLLKPNLDLERKLLQCFNDWPEKEKHLSNFPDSSTSILTLRTSVLEKYLRWRLLVSEDEFKSYCSKYLPLRHRPMCDIIEAIDIAQNDIKFNTDTIRRNGFIISSDPVNTKLIIENVDTLAGYDIREAIRNNPGILKNNYKALLEIKNILQKYDISEDAQRRCFRVYCMNPQSVQERLDQLKELKEYQILSTNPRVLSLVVHKRKMLSRLEKIQSTTKQCYSLNQLVSSRNVFNNYINGFGNKVCGRDMAILITNSIQTAQKDKGSNTLHSNENEKSNLTKLVLNNLKKHKYWLHSSLYIINENIQYLKKIFYGDVILNNCQILLYPLIESKKYFEYFLKKRSRGIVTKDIDLGLDGNYNSINYENLTDEQILSLVIYEIEKKYYFSGDGIWSKQETARETSPHNDNTTGTYEINKSNN
ncbi:transcription termination factor 5, mitochondrial-like [Battus philenor]|uniref:transcription termination factor 5, mitochondrial-like n=1 Tax=Battus philenor TaxID=42288 RepID=UPI0035D0B496